MDDQKLGTGRFKQKGLYIYYFDLNKSLIPIQIKVDLVKVNEKTSGLYDLNIEERYFDKGQLSGGIGVGMGRYG